MTVATLVYVVIFPSTLAYLFFNRGIALIGPNRAAPFLHLVPVFGSAMAILLLGEQPRLFHLAGYLLVLAGVIIASGRGRRIEHVIAGSGVRSKRVTPTNNQIPLYAARTFARKPSTALRSMPD